MDLMYEVSSIFEYSFSEIILENNTSFRVF